MWFEAIFTTASLLITIRVKSKYTQRQKKRENLLTLYWLQIRYVEFKKYILHVELTVYHTVSFACNIIFLEFNIFYFQPI